MLDDLRRHVAIPTGCNHTPGLDEYRRLVAQRAEALGAKIETVPGESAPEWLWGASPDRSSIPPTLVCRRLIENKPRILIACHLDTVFDPAGDFQELLLSTDGQTATGPGVVDMKGGLLIALNALEALEEQGVRVGWTLLCNSDEERGAFHSAEALRTEAGRHDVGICTEPALPGGELAIERAGSGQFMLEALGRSAHAGREFEKGISAVNALARAILRVSEYSDASRGLVVNVGPLAGGAATNAVPDRARAWGNVRYPDPRAGDDLRTRLESLRTTEEAMPALFVRCAFNRPAKPKTAAMQRLAEQARAAAEALGQNLPFEKTGGVCDGNILQDAGLPTIDTMGVRGGGLHTTGEWIEIPSLVQRCQMFAVFLARLSQAEDE